MQFVEEFAGGEAVVELAEESVEQVSLSLMVPVSAGAASIEMPSGSGGRLQGAERPDRSRCGESPVLDVPVCQWPRSSPRRRPVVLPAGGHGFSPVAASCFSPPAF